MGWKGENVYEAVREKVQEEVRAAQRAPPTTFDAAWLRRRCNVAVEVRAMLACGEVGERKCGKVEVWVEGWRGGRMDG